jgi:hypothetical protein
VFGNRQTPVWRAGTLASLTYGKNKMANYLGAGLLGLPVIVMAGLLCLSALVT